MLDLDRPYANRDRTDLERVGNDQGWRGRALTGAEHAQDNAPQKDRG